MSEGGARHDHTGSGQVEAAAAELLQAQRAITSPPPDYRTSLRPASQVVDVETWAGSLPEAYGIAPRIRIGRSRWFNLLWLLPIGFGVLLAAVAAARAARSLPAVQHFIAEYPGTVSTGSVTEASGFPLWVAAQHFLNLFLMMFIIRSGWQILADHPRLYWTRHSTPGRDWFRFQKPVPPDPLWTAKKDSVSLPASVGLPGLRHSIGLARWWHLGMDTLWLLNGLLFYVLCFATPHWQRLVPTSWSVFPNAASVLIQYLSLNWPNESGWVAYNSLQQLAYFVTVFVAAPLALITGLGMSPALSTRMKVVSRRLSIQTARSLHFLVMVWFVVFIVAHTALVVTTGVLRNFNHIYLGRNDEGWGGFWLFAVSMVVVVVAWVGASPLTLRRPRVVQRAGQVLVGPTQRLFEHVDATPGEYTEKDVSPYFWHNGHFPDTDQYRRLQDGGFRDYRLRIHGLVEKPVTLTLPELRSLPHHEQITQHFCIQGWSGVARWGGVSMSTILDLVRPRPEARWMVFYSLAEGPNEGLYYDAPLRLRNEVQLGFKQVKWLAGIEFVADYADIGGGYGGYNEDHEFFGYRQSI